MNVTYPEAVEVMNLRQKLDPLKLKRIWLELLVIVNRNLKTF